MHVFLKKNCKTNVYEKISLDTIRGHKIAVDTSIFMCRFKSSMGTKWLQGFWNMALLFKKHDIQPLFVYDSKAPPEKEKERQNRQESKVKMQHRIQTLTREWDEFDKTADGLSEMDGFPELAKIVARYSMTTKQQLLEYILRIENSGTKIHQEDFDLSKELFFHCGFSTMNAPGEAEALCAFLNRKEIVDGVLTEDTDVLAYRTPVMYHGFDMRNEMVTSIRTCSILDALELSDASFLDFAICCGTDYNRNIPRIGPQKAFDMIREHGRIEDIPKIDTTCLNHVRVRELFNPVYPITEVQWNETPVMRQTLQRFCFENNLRKETEMKEYFF